MSENLSLAFYKHYYKGINFSDLTSDNNKNIFERRNRHLFQQQLYPYTNAVYIDSDCSFKLETTYPGLLCGSGYAHQSKAKGEIKSGFYFDYSTGLPIIPGSSIKGVLRSAFQHPDYINTLLREIDANHEEFDEATLSTIAKNIFDNEEASIYKRDIFFDAFPVQTNEIEGLFLGGDYITPHENPLKDPTPVLFLKVLPQVEYQFKFKLNNSLFISATQKLLLFKKILLDLGLGAKTNVGYGQFGRSEADIREDERLIDEETKRQQAEKIQKFNDLIDRAYTEIENNNFEHARKCIDDAKAIITDSLEIDKCADFITFKKQLNDAKKLLDENKFKEAIQEYNILAHLAEAESSKKHQYHEEIKANIITCEEALKKQKLSVGIPVEKILNINNLKLKTIKQNINKFTNDDDELPKEYHKQLELLVKKLYETKNDKEKKQIGISDSNMEDCKLWDDIRKWVGEENATEMYIRFVKKEN